MVVIVAPRQWRTEMEIRQIVNEESRGWRDEVRDHNREVKERLDAAASAQTIVNDKVLEGVQASFNTAALLIGNEYIRGALPEIRDRLETLERRGISTEAIVEAHHVENTARFDMLERGQNKLRKSLVSVYAWLTDKDSGGNTGWGRIAIVGAVLVWIVTHLPSWNTIKILVARFAWMLHKGIS
jgi:hypothetical protein